MKSYYSDESKLTFDEAERYVEKYVEEYKARRQRVTSKDIAKAYDLETSQHNLIRLSDALDSRFEVARAGRCKRRVYQLSE